MVELQTFCHEILGRVLRDGRIDSPGNRTYCIAAKYDGIKNPAQRICVQRNKTQACAPKQYAQLL
jgi:hypothetical protein